MLLSAATGVDEVALLLLLLLLLLMMLLLLLLLLSVWLPALSACNCTAVARSGSMLGQLLWKNCLANLPPKSIEFDSIESLLRADIVAAAERFLVYLAWVLVLVWRLQLANWLK